MRKKEFEKQTQISLKLFLMLFDYFVNNNHEHYYKIQSMVSDKFEKLLQHEYYTQYKTNPNPEEKEKYRQKYLDAKLIGEDWRW